MENEIVEELCKKFNKKEVLVKAMILEATENKFTLKQSENLIDEYFKSNAINNAIGEKFNKMHR